MSADGSLQGGNVAVEVRAQRGDFLRPSIGEAGEGLLQLGQGRRIPTKGSLECGDFAGLVSQIHITQMAGGTGLPRPPSSGRRGCHPPCQCGVGFPECWRPMCPSAAHAPARWHGAMARSAAESARPSSAEIFKPLVRRQDFQLGNSGQHVGEFTSHAAQVQGVGVFGRPAGTGLRPVDVRSAHSHSVDRCGQSCGLG